MMDRDKEGGPLAAVTLWPEDLDWIAEESGVDFEVALAAAEAVAPTLSSQLAELANELLRDLVLSWLQSRPS